MTRSYVPKTIKRFFNRGRSVSESSAHSAQFEGYDSNQYADELSTGGIYEQGTEISSGSVGFGGLEARTALSEFDPELVAAAQDLRKAGISDLKGAKKFFAKAKKGFTLIELLVVMGVIAILATITIPAMSNALESGRRTKCLSQMKQVGIATALYAGDVTRQGMLPVDSASGNVIWTGTGEYVHNGKLVPGGYLRKENLRDVFYCPSQKTRFLPDDATTGLQNFEVAGHFIDMKNKTVEITLYWFKQTL